MSRVYDPRFNIPIAGTGFYAEYFALENTVSNLGAINFDVAPDMVANVDSLNQDTVYNSFWDGGPEDLFAARYTGDLNVDEAGAYTFYLNSDDGSALYINDEQVINNDGLHAAQQQQVTVDLAAGSHDIEIRYFEAFGAQTLQLYWSAPNDPFTREILSSSEVSYQNEPADGGSGDSDTTPPADASLPNAGFQVDYYAINKWAKGDKRIDFDGNPIRSEVIDHVNFGGENGPLWDDGWYRSFAAKMTGNLHVDEAGDYTFYLTADDASTLYINGTPLVSHDRLYDITTGAFTIALAAGIHDIELRYVEKRGQQNLVLEWRGPDSDGVKELLDGSNLSHGDVIPVDNGDDHGDMGGGTGGDMGDHGDMGGDTGGDMGDHGDDHGDMGGDTGGDMGDHGDDHGDMGGDTGGDMGDHGDDHGDMGGDTGGDMGDHGDNHGDMGGDTGGDMGDHGDDHGDMGGDTDGDMGDHGDDHGDMGGDTGGDMGDHGDDHGDMGGDTGGDMGDHGDDHGDMGGDTDGDMGDHGDDHGGGHGDHHGGGSDVDLPTTDAEIEAFVAAVRAAPEMDHSGHMGGDDAMAAEHAQLLELVPRAEATHIAISNGDWFDPGTWYQGNIPDAGAQVLIPEGVSVNYNGDSDESLFTVRVDGELSFATDIDTKMVVDTLVVSMPGRLEIGTEENPIQSNVTADIVIANNGDIDVGWDSALLSRGVISQGTVEIHGAEKDAFHKVDDAPMRGDTSLTLEEIPDGWQVGDTIVITGTHKTGWTNTAAGHIESQDEEVTITAINGNEISFDQPLRYDHDAPRDDLAAYVSNMTRNITFQSEDGDETPVHHRGHVMFMHNDDIDVRFAAFDDLGRTDKSIDAFDGSSVDSLSADSNVKGRYSFHFHKAGTEDQDDPAMAVGNTVNGGAGWGFVHHSSNANFTDNVTFDVFGAGFVAEAGDETGIWLGNMAIKSEGIGFGDWTAKEGDDVARQDNARTGDGFFFMGRLVEAAENVAVNTTNGFVWMHRNNAADPLASSLDQPDIAFGDETMEVNLTPIQGFRDNEAYGTHTGLMVLKDNAAQQQHELRSVFDGFLNWETTEGVNISYTAHYTMLDFDLIAARNDVSTMASHGVEIGSMAFDMVFNGLRMEGFEVGVDLNQEFFRPVADADVDHIFIDLDMIDVDRDFSGFNANRHHIMSGEELRDGVLDFQHNGDTTLNEGEGFSLGGIKSDSIGTRDREYDGDPLTLEFYDEIAQMITTEGYWRTEDGRNVLIIEDFLVDRATGEIEKFSHIVTLNMTQQQIETNWMFNNYFDGAKFNGTISLGGAAPTARDDRASTSDDQPIYLDVLANDSDADGDQLIIDGILDPEHGDVYLQEDGRLMYQPDIGFTGTDTFRYWASDENGNFSDATVTIDVWT